MDNRFAEIVRTAMTPYRLNLNAGDRLVIVTDTGTDPIVSNAFMAAAIALDLNVTQIMSPPVRFHHDAPAEGVLQAMKGADLVHLVTSKAVIHSEPTHALQTAGQRFLASEEISVDMLREGGATADYERMNRLGEKIYDIWTAGTSMHVTCPNGTDLHGDITGRPSWLTAAKVLENPGCDLFAAGFPDGEVGMSPIEETIEGKVVWDTTMHHVGLLSEPITAEIREGRAVRITGGASASKLLAYLEANGDEGSWMLGEASVGINDKCRVTGFVREDKKIAGCMHIALGMNTDTGGNVASRTHLDGVVRYPTLVVDDTTVIKDGELQVSAD